jgi:hypothetical protein
MRLTRARRGERPELGVDGFLPANANGVETRKPRVGRGTRPTLGPRPTPTQPHRGCGHHRVQHDSTPLRLSVRNRDSERTKRRMRVSTPRSDRCRAPTPPSRLPWHAAAAPPRRTAPLQRYAPTGHTKVAQGNALGRRAPHQAEPRKGDLPHTPKPTHATRKPTILTRPFRASPHSNPHPRGDAPGCLGSPRWGCGSR